MRISDWSSDVCSYDLIIVLVVRCDQPFGEAVKPGGIEPERLDLMISGKGGDSRRRCGRRLRRGFVDSHGGGSDAKSCACTASGEMGSAERRVGKEWGSRCSSRWSPDH